MTGDFLILGLDLTGVLQYSASALVDTTFLLSNVQ